MSTDTTVDIVDLDLIGNLQQGDKVVGERVDGVTVRMTMPYNIHTGTLNRLTVTDGDGVDGNPTYDISSEYIGQNTITTLGTITTAVWNATTIEVSYGGSGRDSATAYTPICGGTTSTSEHQSMLSGSVGQLIYSKGPTAIPDWTTPTYPVASGAGGKILQSDGTNIVYSSATWPTAATNSKFLIGNGTNYVESTSTIPTTAGATANKHLKSNGTNYVLTSATFSDTPGTAGKRLVSDGTNWVSSSTTMPDTATNGKVIIGNGTNYVESATTLPISSSATVRKIMVSDGTNWVASTETYAVPGTSGNILQSNGTNWASVTPTGTGVPVAATAPTITGLVVDQITWSNTTKGILGTTTNNNAATGYTQEYLTATSTSTGIASSTATNIVSLSLTAGDWEVWGDITFIQNAGTTASTLISAISTTSATLGAPNTYLQLSGVAFSSGSTNIIPAVRMRVSIAATTTVYLVGFCVFSVSTMSTTGAIYARRSR